MQSKYPYNYNYLKNRKMYIKDTKIKMDFRFGFIKFGVKGIKRQFPHSVLDSFIKNNPKDELFEHVLKMEIEEISEE